MFEYRKVKTLGVIGEKEDRNGNVWQKEVGIVSWNNNAPKIDIREWCGDRMNKGITLTFEEAEAVAMILHEWARDK